MITFKFVFNLWLEARCFIVRECFIGGRNTNGREKVTLVKISYVCVRNAPFIFYGKCLMLSDYFDARF